VLVKVNGKSIFCDPGSAFAPFGMLPWIETGVEGLQLDKNGGTWIHTTLPASSASRIERHAKLTLSESGDLEGTLSIAFTGLEAMRRRVEQRDKDEADRKRFLEDEAREYVPVAADIDLTNHPDWKSSAPTLNAEYHIKIAGWVTAAGRRALLPIGIFTAPEKNVFDHANREFPIYFEYPFEKHDDVTILLPSGWKTSSLPKPSTIDAQSAAYALEVQQADNSLHLTRKLVIDMLLLGKSYYPALRKFFQIVRTSDDEQVLLEPVETAARN
jgi:hypothetical protein